MRTRATHTGRRALRHGSTGAATDRRGLSLIGALSLTSVVLVLVFVSLPRLRQFAQNENEADAGATAVLLAAELESAGQSPSAPAPTIEDLAADDPVARALSDGVFLEHGSLLRRHGYLFAVVRVEPAGPAPADQPLLGMRSALAAEPASAFAVLAWPWAHGRTGSAAWLATGGGLFRHENAPLRWSGPAPGSGRSLPSWDGWRRVH